MKKVWRMLLLAGVFTVLLCVSALAADTVTGSGFYNIGTAANVKVEPKASSGTVTKTSADVNLDGKYETFYAGSDKLTVTYSGTVAEGDQFVVMLVTGSGLPTTANTICYIDQKVGASGNLVFDVYPKLPTTTGEMTLYITSNRGDFSMIAISLNYAVNGTYDVAPYTLGDINNDKNINAFDATLVLKHSVKLIVLDEVQKQAADVNLDTNVNAYDATGILKKSVKLISDFSEIQKK